MTKKSWLLIFIALALVGAYAYYFTDWFTPNTIHVVSHNERAARPRRANNNPGFLARLNRLANSGADDSTTIPIIFVFQQPYKLTELKIVALDEWQTNKNCLPLWHLVADTNSIPINLQIRYGESIRGMKPKVPGTRAQPLQPGVKYRLFVTDGKARGEHDFQATAKPAEPASP